MKKFLNLNLEGKTNLIARSEEVYGAILDCWASAEKKGWW